MGAPGVYNWKGTVVRLASYSDLGDTGGSAVRRRRRRAAEQGPVLEEQDVIDARLTDVVEENDFFGERDGTGEGGCVGWDWGDGFVGWGMSR